MTSASATTSAEASAPDPDFVVEGASVEFGSLRALDDISLEFPRGSQTAVVGPSGGGKTTLLRLLNAALAPDRGRVEVLGEEVSALSPRDRRALRSRIGHIPQDHGLVPGYRVAQNVVLGRVGMRGFWGSLRDLTFPRSRRHPARSRPARSGRDRGKTIRPDRHPERRAAPAGRDCPGLVPGSPRRFSPTSRFRASIPRGPETPWNCSPISARRVASPW